MTDLTAIFEAARALDRDNLDNASVHPCDQWDDRARRARLHGPARALSDALYATGQTLPPADADVAMFQLLLSHSLHALCRSLTGKEHQGIGKHLLEQVVAGEEFYLPDGGYSRVIVSDLSGKARLTDNSRAEVKTAWSNARRDVADVEHWTAQIRALMHREQVGG